MALIHVRIALVGRKISSTAQNGVTCAGRTVSSMRTNERIIVCIGTPIRINRRKAAIVALETLARGTGKPSAVTIPSWIAVSAIG